MNLTIFILAGGKGTRLKSVVSDVPKPMAPICEKPFLDYQIAKIREYFPKTIIYLLTGYKSEIIENNYKEDEYIKCIKESSPLDTGGCVQNAIEFLKLKRDTSLLILNGDTYLEVNFKKMIENIKYDITILSSFQKDCSRYGTLLIDNNTIKAFNEKNVDSVDNYINAGCYFFRNLDFFQSILKKSFSIEDEFKFYLENNGKINLYKYKGIFIDIGIPEDYNKMIEYIGKK